MHFQFDSQSHTVHVFVDSGADTEFIDAHLAKQLGLKLSKLDKQLGVPAVDIIYYTA